jgi:hypothetical protein
MSAKGEKYKSMAAMKKHEKTEPMKMKMAEKKMMKKVAKKSAKKK